MLNITKTRKPTPPRIVVYGAGGIGKSTLAARFPSPLFFQTEDGLANIDAVSAGLFRNYTDLATALDELRNHPDEYASFKTIVIDSIDCMERLLWDVVCASSKVASIEKIPYGRGYSMAAELLRSFLDLLSSLQAQGKIVLLVAHGVPVVYNDPETTDLHKFDLRLHKTSKALLVEWSDLVLFATRKKGTAKGNISERVLKSQDSPTHYAKSRYNLPDSIAMDAGELLSLVAADQQREAEEVPF